MNKIFLLIMSVFALQLSAQTITNLTTTDGLISDFVECIATDVNDNIWFGTSVGIQKFDGSNWITYTNADGLVNNNVKVITTAINGNIWVGTDFGSSKFDGTSWVTYDNTNGLNSSQVKSITEDANGGIWVGTNQGVSYFDGNTWVSYSSPDLHWSGVNSTVFDSNGDAWFASPLGGITHFDGTTFTPYDTSNGLLSQFVTALLIDNQDNKWVGTSSGMSVLDASNTSFTQHTRMYIMPPPDTLNPVVNIARDSYGRIWTIWTYVSMDYFKQKIKKGEVGSSAMPHKVNPIDFENAAGNLGIANAIFNFLSSKLPVSRLQRDLTDSTVLRNIGVPFAHSLIALASLNNGINKLLINRAKIEDDLEENWAVVAEAIQTILRREGYPNPYEALKELTRTNSVINAKSISSFIDTLELNDNIKQELKTITPSNYTGI